MLETLATYEMEQAKRTRPSKQDQASGCKWKDAGCFLAKQQPLSCIFCTKAPTNHLFAKCVGEEQ